MIDDLTARLEEECTKLFGDPSHFCYDGYNKRVDRHEWRIYTRLFGRRASFFLELSPEDVADDHAVEIAMHRLAFDIMREHEQDLLRGYQPYFAVDREHTTGIVRGDGKYAPERWDPEKLELSKTHRGNVPIGRFVVE